MCVATLCAFYRLHTYGMTSRGFYLRLRLRNVTELDFFPRHQGHIHRSTHAPAATSSHSMVNRTLLLVLISCLAACAAGQGGPALQGLP